MKALNVTNLQKTFPNGTHALAGLSFSVEEGDFFALLGPNGAGKSTTINIITSLSNKTKGSIEIFGHDIDTDFAMAKACIGVVPQEFNFNIFDTPWQILLNQAGYYGVPRHIAKERAEETLKQLELWDKRHVAARMLSGGMKRRLMIARALLHRPRLLILDEPTAGVDIEIRRSMWRFLTEINKQGTTVILTTHYLEEAENLCRNIAIINRGRIVENTSMNQLLRKLNLETFIMNIDRPLTSSPELKNFHCQLMDETTLSVSVYKDQTLNDLFSELSTLNISVMSMRNKANRLEELFIDVIKQDGISDILEAHE